MARSKPSFGTTATGIVDSPTGNVSGNRASEVPSVIARKLSASRGPVLFAWTMTTL
jgi:hypothetical protein